MSYGYLIYFDSLLLKRELLDKNLAFVCQPVIAGQPKFK
jgi:hypothetical protein